eukprot:43747-Rhodomonas_salina.1
MTAESQVAVHCLPTRTHSHPLAPTRSLPPCPASDSCLLSPQRFSVFKPCYNVDLGRAAAVLMTKCDLDTGCNTVDTRHNVRLHQVHECEFRE